MNEETIFAAALEKQTASERQAFLDQACAGQPNLRAQVEELLRADADAGSFLNHPPAGMDATVASEAGGDTRNSGQWTASLPFLRSCDKPGRLGLLSGKVGEYEIIEVVGQGGMGAVLRAFDTKLSRVVAVKVMAPELAANPNAVKRFLREAKTAAAIHHEHVVTIHAIDDTHRPPFLVMQFVEGQTLQQKIDNEGALELKQILRIGSQMAAGLAAAHKHGLIHRDVKPGNVLLENGVERVKITDFGLARAADDLEMTQTGTIAGTPQYMSPEQAKGETIDTRSDLFSLGSVLYTMCTGRAAFRAETTMGVLKRVCEDSPRPIHELNAEIPAWLEAIVGKLLAKNPGERFQTAAEVSELLGQCLAHVQQPGQSALPQLPAMLPHAVSAPDAQVTSAARRRSLQLPLFLLFMPLGLLAAVVWAALVLGTAPRILLGIAAALAGVLTLAGLILLIARLASLRVAHSATAPPRAGMKYPAPREANRVAVVGLVLAVAAAVLALPAVLAVLVVLGWLFYSTGRATFQQPIAELVERSVQDDATGTVPARDVSSATSEAAGWTPLFNGTDLTGWKTHPSQPGGWTVEDNLLVGRAGPGPHYLFSERSDYENFHFRVEAKINSKGDAGQVLRCEYGFNAKQAGANTPLGYEANLSQLGVYKTGTLFGADWPPAGTGEAMAPDTWFTQEVIARGNHIQIKVNGRTTADYVDLHEFYRRGHLALQAWEPGTVVYFRKIEVKELPPLNPQATLPMTLVSRLDPAKDKPISAEYTDAGADGWLFTTDDWKGFRLLELRQPAVENCRVIGRLRMKSVQAREAYPRLIARFADGSASDTIGTPNIAARGDTNWTTYEVTLDLKRGQRPEIVELGLHMEGRGTSDAQKLRKNQVWIKEVELLTAPLPESKPIPATTAELKALRELVAAKQRNLEVVKAQFAEGRQTPLGVKPAEIELIEARIRLAEAESDAGVALALLRELVSTITEERALTQKRVDAGIDPTSVLNGVDARLADARVRLAQAEAVTPAAAASSASGQAAPPAAIAPFAAAQAKAHQEAWANYLGVEVEIQNSLGMKLRLIPPGEFLMGSSQEEADQLARALEQGGAGDYDRFVARASSPQHRVRITQPFYFGAHEVTVGQYRMFIEETKHVPTAEQLGVKRMQWTDSVVEPNAQERAVIGVSWDDAKAFCAWLSKKEGRTYDLPSEAQWEYACRAGTVTAWSFGDDAAKLADYAVFSRSSFWPAEVVGSKLPNPFGLFDMHGNADEWCLDWHSSDFYKTSPVDDPVCMANPDNKNSGRVARSGTAHSAAWWTRSTTRPWDFPQAPANPKGFRVVMVGDLKLVGQAGGASAAPAPQEPVAFVWGPVRDGWQVGVGWKGGKLHYKPGESVEFELKVRNATDAEKTVRLAEPNDWDLWYSGGSDLHVRIFGRDERDVKLGPREEKVIDVPKPLMAMDGLVGGLYKVRVTTPLGDSKQQPPTGELGFYFDDPNPPPAWSSGGKPRTEPLKHPDAAYQGVAWGEPVLGLSFGLRPMAKDGDDESLEFFLWNAEAKAVDVEYLEHHPLDWQLRLRDKEGQEIRSEPILTGPKIQAHRQLAAGEVIALGIAKVKQLWNAAGTPKKELAAGSYQVSSDFNCRRLDYGHLNLRIGSGEAPLGVKVPAKDK